jgi:hypothetical protein
MSQEEQTYTQDEAEAILRIAAQRPLPDPTDLVSLDRIGHAELERSAVELGISYEALERAESEYALQLAQAEILCEDLRCRKLFQESRRAGFLRDVIAYGLLNLLALVLFFEVTPFMFFWPSLLLLASGIRLAPTLSGYLSKRLGEKQYQTWSSRNWGAAMYGSDYWRHRAGGRDPAVSRNPEADIHLYLELRIADREFLKKSAESGISSKLDAMKRFQEATGVGLGTAKLIVDDYEYRNPGSFK